MGVDEYKKFENPCTRSYPFISQSRNAVKKEITIDKDITLTVEKYILHINGKIIASRTYITG